MTTVPVPQQINDLSEKIAADIRTQGVSRGTVGGGVVLGEIQGVPPTIASFVPTQLIGSMSVPSVSVTSSGTKAGVVTPGSTKPTGTAVASGQIALAKHAGLGTFTLEQFLTAQGVAAAVTSVLGQQCLLSFETAAQAVLAGNATSGGTKTKYADAIAAGQAAVLAAGGRPSVVSIAAADYAALILEVSALSGFAASPESPVGTLWGSTIHVSAGQTAGAVIVLDSSAAIVFQHEQSPLVLVDSLSQASKNISQVVVDLLAVLTVSNPTLVVKVTKSP